MQRKQNNEDTKIFFARLECDNNGVSVCSMRRPYQDSIHFALCVRERVSEKVKHLKLIKKKRSRLCALYGVFGEDDDFIIDAIWIGYITKIRYEIKQYENVV